jgi:hypothetical protein
MRAVAQSIDAWLSRGVKASRLANVIGADKPASFTTVNDVQFWVSVLGIGATSYFIGNMLGGGSIRGKV